jgi:flagellar hook protein FlgE
MLRSLNTALSGLQQFQQQIDVVGNNIANVNTTGFKGARVDFEDSFSQAIGAGSPSNQVGTGVTTGAIQNNFNSGTINNTGFGGDLAIVGQGFFVVKNATDSSQYVTRAGDFHLDSANYLVTNDGLRVQGYSDAGLTTLGDLKIDATGAPSTAAPGATMKSWSIDSSGKIMVMLSDNTEFVRGQVLLQNYSNPGALIKQGANLYSASSAAGPLATLTAPGANGTGAIQSGALEASNVDLTAEMVNLITAQRAFQANARVITTSDEILQEVASLKR